MAEINPIWEEELKRYRIEKSIQQKTLEGLEINIADEQDFIDNLMSKKLIVKESIGHIDEHIKFLEERIYGKSPESNTP